MGRWRHVLMVAAAAASTFAAVYARRRRRAAGRAAAAAPAQNPASFFITSVGKGDGANYGGLAGADAYCAQLAQAANLPAPPGRTWRAYLSAGAANGQPSVNARDRIGAGPWYNARGALIAANVADLHGDVQRDRNAINKQQALTEKGQPDQRRGRHPQPARHPDRFRLTWTRDRRRDGHHLRQLHSEHRWTRQRDGGAPRPYRRRQHVVEFRARVAGLQPGRTWWPPGVRDCSTALRRTDLKGPGSATSLSSPRPRSTSSICQSASGCGPSLMPARSGSSPGGCGPVVCLRSLASRRRASFSCRRSTSAFSRLRLAAVGRAFGAIVRFLTRRPSGDRTFRIH